MKPISIFTHLAAAIIVSGIMMTMYATVQQVHRSAANDPQLQLARDISAKLGGNSTFNHLLPDDTIDISGSLGTFVTFYNANGEPIASTGMLDGKMPQIPKGVFDFAKTNKENDVTWQPRSGVRMAMVIESVPSSSQVSFVAVGRSLQEVEIRESNLTKMIFITWFACMGIIIIHGGIYFYLTKNRQKVSG